MPLGHLDELTTTGGVRGWAFDETRPGEPLLVSVQDAEGTEVAVGLANRYRRDLAEAGHAFGWCAFQFRLARPLAAVAKTPLQLVARASKQRLFGPHAIPTRDAKEDAVETIDDLAAADPTVLGSLDEVDGCGELLEAYLKARGAEAFVRTAYAYVLGRTADGGGLSHFVAMLRQRRLTAYALLWTLADGEEFRSRPRKLPAPTSPGFPFLLAS